MDTLWGNSDIENKTGRWYYISAIAIRSPGNQVRVSEHIEGFCFRLCLAALFCNLPCGGWY
ncbi:MAG: hypothetical protein NC300_07080 [Bacteroidales bacterium]|nr:hypothetical protein [Clostridium sp.]MCM1203889.1 hypothetical protein [Bacteroidales bacterium]